jgi:hypothetical protein
MNELEGPVQSKARAILTPLSAKQHATSWLTQYLVTATCQVARCAGLSKGDLQLLNDIERPEWCWKRASGKACTKNASL